MVFKRGLAFINCVTLVYKSLAFRLCLFAIKKIGQQKTLSSQKNLVWFPEKYFPLILGGKHFIEIVKNLEMSYYLLIISNLILKLLIAIYIFCFEY